MSNQVEPQQTGKFVVEFDDEEVAGWETVTIPPVSTTEGNYRDGTETDSEEQWKYIESLGEKLEMERSLDPDDTVLLDWQRELWEGGDAEKDVRITLLDRRGEPIARWELLDALPVIYEPPDLDGSDEPAEVTEAIEVSFDMMIRSVP